jgi:hypothetical protein
MIGKLCAILCGVAVTWTCAAFGLLVLSGHGHYGSGMKQANGKVRRVEQALNEYSLDRGRCPPKRMDLIAGGYLRAKDLLDPWGKPIEYSCSDDAVKVESAGQDRTFGTPDDVKNEY